DLAASSVPGSSRCMSRQGAHPRRAQGATRLQSLRKTRAPPALSLRVGFPFFFGLLRLFTLLRSHVARLFLALLLRGVGDRLADGFAVTAVRLAVALALVAVVCHNAS